MVDCKGLKTSAGSEVKLMNVPGREWITYFWNLLGEQTPQFLEKLYGKKQHEENILLSVIQVEEAI
jgi:hypothetical protein